MLERIDGRGPRLLRLPLVSLPAFEVEPVHQKQIACPGVPAAAVHASDLAHLLGAHVHPFSIHQIIVDVDMDDPADLEPRAGTERNAGDEVVFEAYRRLRDPWSTVPDQR